MLQAIFAVCHEWFNRVFFDSAVLFFVAAVTPCFFIIAVQLFWPQLTADLLPRTESQRGSPDANGNGIGESAHSLEALSERSPSGHPVGKSTTRSSVIDYRRIWGNVVHSCRGVLGTVVCIFGLALFYGLTKRFPNHSNASALSAGFGIGSAFVSLIFGVRLSRQVILEKLERMLSSIQMMAKTSEDKLLEQEIQRAMVELKKPADPSA